MPHVIPGRICNMSCFCCVRSKTVARPPTIWGQSTRILNMGYHAMERHHRDWQCILIACDMRRQAALLYGGMDRGHHHWYVKQLTNAFQGMVRDSGGLKPHLRPAYAHVLRDMYELVLRGSRIAGTDDVRHLTLASADIVSRPVGILPYLDLAVSVDDRWMTATATVRNRHEAKRCMWTYWVDIADVMLSRRSRVYPRRPDRWWIYDAPAWDDCLNNTFPHYPPRRMTSSASDNGGK